jgi:hypothetical protein
VRREGFSFGVGECVDCVLNGECDGMSGFLGGWY